MDYWTKKGIKLSRFAILSTKPSKVPTQEQAAVPAPKAERDRRDEDWAKACKSRLQRAKVPAQHLDAVADAMSKAMAAPERNRLTMLYRTIVGRFGQSTGQKLYRKAKSVFQGLMADKTDME